MEHLNLVALAQSGTFAVIVDGHWEPGIGDPTPMGWFTVVAYGIACILCIRAAYEKPGGLAAIDTTKHAMFWFTLGIVMFIFTINKQLDFQAWLWLTGRNMIDEYGWSEHKKTIQISSMLAVIFISVAELAYFIWLTRSAVCRQIFRHRLFALSGVVFTLCFIIIRALSLHGVDKLLGWRLGELRINWVLENMGILLVAVGAHQAVKYSKGINFDA